VRVTLKETVVWADVEGELVLLEPETGAYYALNETGADVWRQLAAGPAGEQDLLDRLVDGYAVEPSVAAADLRRLLVELEASGLVTVEP
jgi:Coenzyme PQQ synthesis protein D (PqqD)